MGGFIALTYLERRHALLPRIRRAPVYGVAFHALLIIASFMLGSDGGTDFIYFQF